MEHRNENIFITINGKDYLEISIQNHFLHLENSRKIHEKMFINNMEEYIIVTDVMVVILKNFKDVVFKCYLSGVKECYFDEKEYQYVVIFKISA